MEKINRAMHFDFHTCKGIPNLLEHFNANEFAKKLSDNHVEYINFAARCNMGFSYYNTKIGIKYPSLSRDILKEIIEACHKKNIKVTAYINVGLNHEMMVRHKDWCKVNKDGGIFKENKQDNFFRMCCYNSDYGNYLLEEIKEIASYDIDGIFSDCMIDRECYCEKCLKAMKEKGIDISDDNAVMDYQHQLKIEMAKKIKETALSVSKKPLLFYFNSVPWDENLHTHAEIECLTSTSLWGYDYFFASAPYARTRFNDLIFMSGRFQNGWGDFGGIKSLTSMQDDMHTALMYGFGISFGDHMHPIDGLEDEVIERIGKVFEEEMLYEPFLEDSKAVIDVGVLADFESNQADMYLQGICRILCDMHILYNIYNVDADLSDVKLLIISKEFKITDKLKHQLTDYLKFGGKILFLGNAIKTGKELEMLEYISVIKDDENDNAYFTYGKNGMRWAMYYPSLIIKNKGGIEKSKYVKNIFNYTFDGTNTNFYRPQGEITEYSTSVIKNNTACICFDVSTAYHNTFLPEIRYLVKDLIDDFLQDKWIESIELPVYSLVSITKSKDYLVLHVKADYPEIKNGKGILEDHTYMKSVELSVRGKFSVETLPKLEKVESKIINNRTHFYTGDFMGYKAFILKKIN